VRTLTRTGARSRPCPVERRTIPLKTKPKVTKTIPNARTTSPLIIFTPFSQANVHPAELHRLTKTAHSVSLLLRIYCNSYGLICHVQPAGVCKSDLIRAQSKSSTTHARWFTP
jgi:hypothetical protein